MENVYENRVVAFVDILGFKNHISKTVNERGYASHILKIMKSISKIKDDNENGYTSLKHLGKEISVFSDSIVISYPLSREGGLFHILIDLIHIQLGLIYGGIVLRGGIAIGELYHSGNIVFGPAMIEAYELESKVAIFPRIIIDNKSINLGIEATTTEWNSREYEVKEVNELIIKDITEDNIFYLDYLSQYQEFDESLDYYDFLDKVKQFIIFGLCNNSDYKTLEKYEWLKEYFNSTIKKLGIRNSKILKKDYKSKITSFV